MFNRKFFAIIAAVSLLIINFATQPAYAASNENEVDVSMELVKETMKPQLLTQQLQQQQLTATRAAKLKEVKAEQARLEAQEKAEQEAQAKKEAEQQAKAKQAVSQAPSAQAASTNNNQISGVNKGTFKLSFYDPAVLGSNMGYGGVAANLSVFPKGTKLKITLSDGTVWIRVVNDTGSFAASNPNQLDVAMPNSQVPSAGILYATVEVIG